MNEAELERAMIEEIVGQEPRRHALRRGFALLPRTLPYLRPYKKLAILSVLLTVLVAVVALAEPWPLAFVIDNIIGDKPLPGWLPTPFGEATTGLILLAVFATMVLTLLSGGITVINEYLSTKVDQWMVLDLRSEMFEHAQKLSLAFHDDERKGVLMYRINSQAAALGQIVTSLPILAQSVLTIIGMAIITFHINSLLALLALGITPFIAYSTTFYADRIEPRIYRVRGMGAMNLAIVYEAMAMMRVVMAFGRERREFRRFRHQGERWADATVDLTVRQTVFKLVVQLITAGGTAAVIGVGAYQAVNGQISAGELLVVLSYIAQVYTPLEELTNTLASYQQWFINLRMSFDLIDLEPEVKEKRDAVDLGRGRGEVELRNVAFGYKTREDVLQDISFKVPGGGSIAIVGPTGAGKSTLVSLLPRFYEVAGGRVQIDGHDVRDLKLKSLRSQFSIVLQEPLLFSGTVYDNILYGNLEASREEVERAAQAANAHDFITALPDGYDTMVGEHGTKISGGERQRIAVARAFLRDAPILILDEPTSSIDSRTESVILEALERLMVGRTTIVIAHRLSTIRNVDRILVMQQGRIVQEGTHDELVAEPDGLYHELWEAQTRVYRGRPRRSEDLKEEAQAATGAAARLALSQKGAAGADGDAPPPALQLIEGSGEGSGAGDAPGETRRRLTPVPELGGNGKPKIVLLGMLTKIPVGGVAWLVGQYAFGFERLGYEVYYVEAHARTPSMFMTDDDDRGTERAVEYLAAVAERFGLKDRWSFQALHEGGRCYGMSREQLDRLYKQASLIINMHGGTLPLPEHVATDRLVFLGTDPVEVELEVHRGDQRAIDFLDQHVAHFTWGLNYGNPDCGLPWARPFGFVPSPPPVVMSFWRSDFEPDGEPFTTIGNWRQPYREVSFEGRTYKWSKDEQFRRIIELPERVDAPFELALSSFEDADRELLERHGWQVRSALPISQDLDRYSVYIVRSAGEISAAKEQNVHFRSGWFSERSAMYLAAGRPVVLQDTGFGNALPTGEGLFAFSDIDGAAAAIEEIQSDPARHRQAARDIAIEYLRADLVLGDILNHVGLRAPEYFGHPKSSPAPAQWPRDLSLRPVSRRPLELPEETLSRVVSRPVPMVRARGGSPRVSVVVPVLNNLACTRMALESVLANTQEIPLEVIAIDNGSSEQTRRYLEVLAARNPQVLTIRNVHNRGFAAACNQGLEAATGEVLVLLNNDTIVPRRALRTLADHAEEREIGLVGPTTNRCGGPAEVHTSYLSYGEMVAFAHGRQEGLAGTPPADIRVVEMFCAAMRREVFDLVGPLDERFELGMFEDDDYSRRVRDAGLRVVCVQDVFVHHFGEASLGLLAARGRYGELFHANRRRFEEKWGVTWEPHDRRRDPEYGTLTQRLDAAVRESTPEGATVLVVSKGDDALVRIHGRRAWHFPQLGEGMYAGHHPADDEEAITELERMRESGAEYLVLPATYLWWLEHYEGLNRHLAQYRLVSDEREIGLIYELQRGGAPSSASGEGA